MIVCLRIAFERIVEKMITILNSVEGQASCSNERYLLFEIFENSSSFYQDNILKPKKDVCSSQLDVVSETV